MHHHLVAIRELEDRPRRERTEDHLEAQPLRQRREGDHEDEGTTHPDLRGRIGQSANGVVDDR